MRDLLLRHFGYIYVPLFGNSDARASAILASIMKANGGRHPLGYKSFHVARAARAPGGAAGILRLKTKLPGEWFGAFFGGLSALVILLRHLGARGTFSTLRSLWAIRTITPNVEADELHVVYIAVGDDALKRGVGEQLLAYAKAVAARAGKRLVSLYVRGNNANAQGFFLSQGFAVEKIVADKATDDLLKQGPSIRMVAEVRP